MEVSPFLIAVSLGATIFFGWLCFFINRQPAEKKSDDIPPPCLHKKPIPHYYEDSSTGIRVIVYACTDCSIVLPPATGTLARLSPQTLGQIRQELGDQGYDTAALPYIPVEDTP